MAGVPFVSIDSSIRLNSEAPVPPGLLPSDDQPKNRLRNAFQTLLDLVFPPRCAGCGRVDTQWCGRCQQAVDQTPFLPTIAVVQPLAGIVSTGLHTGKLQQAVHALKYEGVTLLAARLSARMASCLHL